MNRRRFLKRAGLWVPGAIAFPAIVRAQLGDPAFVSALTQPASGATEFKKTIAESGGDYTNLADWQNACKRDLVASNQYAVAEIIGTWASSSATVAISGWTTGPNNYIEIRAVGAAKHSGVWNTSCFRIERSDGLGSPLLIVEEYVRVNGLQLKNTNATGHTDVWVDATVSPTSDVRISNCICWGVHTVSGNGYGISLQGGTTRIWNTIVYGWNFGTGDRGLLMSGASTVGFVYNCTFFDNVYSFRKSAGTLTCYNCLSQGNSDDFNGTIAGDYNCSANTTAPGANSLKSKNVVFVNETPGSEDLFIDPSDTSGCLTGGLTDPASGLFSDNIAGTTRTPPWTIGAG